jgi:putative acetyltransferase
MGATSDLVVAVDDPRADDVRALLATHLAFARAVTPPGHVHALEVDALVDPAVTFFSARRDGTLLGVAALRHLDRSHAELKSMHTSERARGQGIGRAIVDHVLAIAVDRGYERLSLETGTGEAFLPAHTLYANAGFVPCAPFGAYTQNPHSTCMTIAVAEPLRLRLRGALTAAMRSRDRIAVSALRSTLAAIDNAEAVAAPETTTVSEGPIAGARSGLGATEVPRVPLSESDVVAIVRVEIADRRAAAAFYAQRGRADVADRLQDEAAVLARLSR